MLKRTKKAQAILEYVIVLVAIVAGFLIAKDFIRGATTGMLTEPMNAAARLTSQINFLK